MATARAQWTRAAAAEPDSDAAQRAKAELDATGSAPVPVSKPKSQGR